mgnify:CR=1 FL=1
MWGVLHSSLMLYEANNVVCVTMMVHNRRLILANPFQQLRKQVWSVQVWKTMTTITLWALWKCRCNRLYDAADQRLSNVLLEIWENLPTIVHDQYDNMRGSPKIVNKRRKMLLHLWKKLPMFTESTQWHYQLPWTLSWILVNHGRMQQQTPTPFTKSYLWF